MFHSQLLVRDRLLRIHVSPPFLPCGLGSVVVVVGLWATVAPIPIGTNVSSVSL